MRKLFTLLLAIAASVGIGSAAITVRLDPSSCSSWDDVLLWAWTDEGNLFDSWPGQIVSQDGDGWYSYTFDEDITSVSIIWNNGGTYQTVDIEGVTSSTCYALNSTSGTAITVSVVDCSSGSSIGGTPVSGKYKIGDLYYNLDATNQTAEVTSQNSDYPYWATVITTANIPASVTCNSVTYSVTSIGDQAFEGCSGLTSVTISNGVTSIGNLAFYYCSGLTSVTIPNSVTSIGDQAFEGCSGLTSVTIPNSVTSIGNTAFAYCSGLKSVTIPNSVTSIGGEAFSGCIGLTSMTIPNSVNNIGSSAFQGCSGLTSVTILSDNFETEGGVIFINCPNLTYMSGPAKMLYIPDEYLALYIISRRLKNVIITGGEMTENEFLALHEAYKSLESVDMSAASNTTLSDEAFKDCYNLTELKLPAGLTKINYMAVAGCKNLQSIDIPASVEEIEQSAFEDCRSIQTITFGGSANPAPGRFNAPAAASQLKRIGNWAFYNAHELQHLTIPEGVTEIGDGAFYGCTYLEDLVLPSSVRAIGDNCFALCAKLKKIVVNSVTPPEIEAKTFYDVKRQIPVYVPDEAVSAYEADTYWQEFDIQGASQMPTGIDNVSSSLQGGDRGRLILRNGQIYILRGEKEYTLTGQEVK